MDIYWESAYWKLRIHTLDIKGIVVNIFELLFFGGIAIVIYFCGKFVGLYWGITGWVLGCLAASIIILMALRFLRKILKQDTFLPPCKKCSSVDKYKIYGLLKDGSIHVCCCGKKYFLSNQRFMEVSDGGFLIPYMRRKRGIWRAERDQVTMDEVNIISQ